MCHVCVCACLCVCSRMCVCLTQMSSFSKCNIIVLDWGRCLQLHVCLTFMSSFSKSETCVVGYNNLKFDDEFVRQMFYRNFYNPYAREWRNGNSRWDVIDMFRMAYALRPDGIQWPKDDTGSVTFRLEELTRANDIEHSDAHDAVSDVLATINLTKLLRKIQPKLFEFFYALRKKDRIAKTLNLLDKKPVIHVPLMGKHGRRVS